MRITRILGLVTLLAWSSRPALGQLKYFGYVYGGESAAAVAATYPYTNTASTDGHITITGEVIVPESIVAKVALMRSFGQLALIDLGQVIWVANPGPYSGVCPQTPNATHCLPSNYVDRWNAWRIANAPILTPEYVVALKIIDEPVHRGIANQEVHSAATLVKNTFPSIKTVVIEAVGPTAPYFANSTALDWVGLDFFGYGGLFHPASDPRFSADMAILKAQMYPGQKIAYVMEAIWDPYYGGTPADLGPIAQEWYQVAVADPLAVALYPFLWAFDSPGSTVGSRDLPQSVRDQHIVIGQSIVRPRTQNLVFNPSLEGGITSGWALFAFTGAASMQPSASPHSGFSAAQVTVTTAGDVDLVTTPPGAEPGGAPVETKAIEVTPGTSYTFSVYMRSAGGATGGLRLVEQDAAGVPIRDNFLASGGGTGQWVNLTSVLTTATNTRYVSLRLLHWTAGVFTWDDVFFGTSNTAPNPSFEHLRDADANQVNGWGLQIASGAGTMAVSGSARTGTRAVQVSVTAPGSVDLAAQVIPVFPGSTYTYSAYLLSSGGAQAGLRILEADGAGATVRDNFLANGGGSGTWALLTGSLTTTATTRFVSLHLVHHISAGVFTWDDVYFATTNLAPDPSFELGTSSSLSRWVLGAAYGYAAVSVSTNARSGTRAARVDVWVPGDVNLLTSPEATAVPVTPNTSYTYSAYLISSGGAQAGLRVIEWSDTGQVLKDNFVAVGGGTGSWQQLAGVLTTTSTTHFVSLRLVHHISAGIFTWDDVAFTKN